MKNRLLPAAAVALLALSACKQKTEVVSATAPDPQAEALANRPKVELPPAITATRTFRCKDQSLATVDFYAGNKQVTVKVGDATIPVKLTAESDGAPFKADGFVLTGTPAAITLTSPGKPEQACKA
ncbi:hypothetical protein QH494_04375 [Sphingomonas sp. AR_OL41]|jgi:hypothetical protein|uniref:hypothetical protein n=1 Tax=Sphingomonas sp. AR_OL41 TaxID=3042729 RepID=UPI002480AEF5|nr:hypothetical protein [Sphingomonas sp. AR_OL41]MDH7971408.1 hypothetical protein [Sphingomonas sp. AR_OL41]